MMQRNERPERVVANGAIQTLGIGRPVSGSRTVLDDPLWYVQNGSNRTDNRLCVLANYHLIVGGGAVGGIFIKAVEADADIFEPTAMGHGFVFGGAGIAEAFATGTTVMF